MQATRDLTTKIYWYKDRHCWRFPYRDPDTQERKFLFCTADKFARAGIDLPFPDIVRKDTATAHGLCKRLQNVFLRSLAAIEPAPEPATAAGMSSTGPANGKGGSAINSGTGTASTVTAPGDAIPTVAQAIERFFDLYEKSLSYAKGLRAIFGEFLAVTGDQPLDRVRDTDLKIYERHVAQRVGRTSVLSYMRQLGMLLHFGVKKGWIRQDPRLTYRMPKEELKEPNPFAAEELARFWDKIVRQPVPGHPMGWNHWEWIGTGLLHLGLRPIELMHARWEDVNFEERFMFVRRSHSNKMPQACQNQPIPKVIWPLFEARGRVERDGKLVTRPGLVWASYFGEPVTAGVLHRGRESLQAKLPGFMWKRFRKSHATILEQAGNDVIVVSRLLRQSAGGKNVSMAARHYVGRSQRYLRQVVDEAFAAPVALGVNVMSNAEAEA